jgi:hypothetical protein
MFERGPPSRKGVRATNRNHTTSAAPVSVPIPRSPYKPEASGSPWAADHQLQWDKPANSYGAGLGVPVSAPKSFRGDGTTQAEPLSDGIVNGYTSQLTRSMPVGRSPTQRGAGAPWALDADEPMMSVSQAAFRGSTGRTSAPDGGSGPTLSAKDMKAKMQGAGNLLSWD